MTAGLANPAGTGRRDLWLAAGLAAALHALLFVGLPAALVFAPARAGQNPGVTSLEIALTGPAAPSASVPELPKEPEIAPLPEVSQADPEAIREPEPALARPEQVPEITQPEAGRPEPPKANPAAPSAGSSGAKAAMVSRHNIVYPPEAMNEGREGAPVVRVEVLATGRAGKVEMVEGSGHADLDAAALSGLKTAWYQPATDGRRPVASTRLFQPRFVMENGRPRVR